MSSETKLRPLYVQVHPRDTVAIIVNEGGLPAGTRFDSGLTLGIRVDAGYSPWASASGQFKGFDFGETDLKLGYQMGKITPYVVGGVGLAKATGLNGFTDGGTSANALFSGPGALQAVGVAGVGVDYQITSNVKVGVAAYANSGGAAIGR